jgi:hypothetical protein
MVDIYGEKRSQYCSVQIITLGAFILKDETNLSLKLFFSFGFSSQARRAGSVYLAPNIRGHFLFPMLHKYGENVYSKEERQKSQGNQKRKEKQMIKNTRFQLTLYNCSSVGVVADR